MKKSMITLSVMALLGSGAAMAAGVVGGSSSDLVKTYAANHGTFGGGNSGLELNNYGTAINIANGPVKGSNAAIAARGNGTIMKPADLGMLPLPINIAQVWKASATQGTSNFVVNSIRQITALSFAPQFGGLVIGQVADANGTPLALGSGVYFGEWAPRAAGTPPTNSTDLNMGSSDRTVWYVGDNATTTMPTLTNATYNVIGIQGVGTAADNLPTAPKLYGGTLTANYGGGSGTLAGSITNGTNTVNFAGTTIGSTGKFGNGTGGVGVPGTIEGQFYNNASALAGIYKGGTAASNVAFGGSRSN